YLANWSKIKIGMTFAEVSRLLQLDHTYRLDFSYRKVSNDGGAIAQIVRRGEGIPVVPVERVTVYRSNVLWYSLKFRADTLFAKRDAQLSPTKFPSIENLEAATVSGTVSGTPYVGGILDEKGDTDIPMWPLGTPFCPGMPEWY